ncbi:stage III sporulation protein AH [Tissierella praeacuta DSM 18095]|uniref:Stage III sporulation protein AH n=1 Tax=Tissierella praeacuta DSM 18095 TaxID=1123404 RepID=A0A1M4SD32_9FIRM|nr:SpoIIIAH-like family protein [Tissierella praeacuta]SHE30119.1 stage III sporulation protein AH [Tissierella praeacuta DSM 18095]SUP01298.1 Stage III sporulation protein AH [Tissierella praeacuta]
MFKIKRPAIIGLLVVLLVFTGYLNHQLTQQAQRKSSKDYQNHELMEMTKNQESNEELEIVKTDDNIDIIDSAKNEGNEALETMYTEASKDGKNYFVEYRLSRDKLRASLIDRLDVITNNSNTAEDVRKEAQREIMKLGNNSEKELQIEGLIKGKGFEDAIVFLTDKDIKIVVSTNELSEQDMVKILDIVKSETNYDNNNIKIMKKQ